MDVVWRLLNTNDVRNWIGVRTTIYLDTIQVAACVCKQDDLNCAIRICEPEIALEERRMPRAAMRRCQRWKLNIWRNNNSEVVAAAVAPPLWVPRCGVDVVDSLAMLGRGWRFLGDGIDDVGFDAIDPGGSKSSEDLVLHLASQLSAHLIDRPP
jgi:hypothetical protein